MSRRVQLRFEGSLAHLILSRPEKHNGIDFEMLGEVVAAQRTLRKRRDVRAILLYGEGPSFCAGLDFKTVLAKPLAAALKYPQLYWWRRNTFQRWSMGLRDLGAPVLAAIHGSCLGGGLQLALGADVRFCTPDARLSLMEAKWGLVPDMGGPALLRELVRIDVAKELTFTGRVVTGTEAHALGLVTHLEEDPRAAARALAEELARVSPDSVAASKFLLQEAFDRHEEGALRSERRWQRRVLGFRNQRTAMAKNRGDENTAYGPRTIG
jgi:enoyl-CoA hydratase/carnithine racemase